MEGKIMKTTKRAAAILTAGFLALTMCAPVSMTAFAGTLTIQGGGTEDATHQYKAYAIITGNLASDGKTLSDLEWGNDINPTNLIAALVANKTDLGINVTSTSTIDEIAKELAKLVSDTPTSHKAQRELLAKIIGDDPADNNDSNNVLKANAGSALTKNDDGNYVSGNLENGWYLIEDDLTPGEGQAKSANLLQIMKSTTITKKYSLPTLEKVIYDADDTADPEKKVNDASIGDTVTYHLKTAVPNMTGYDKYYFVINDTLSKGLTYTDHLTVQYGTAPTIVTLDPDTDGPAGNADDGDYYLVESAYSADSGTTLKIVFKDFYTKFNSVAADTPILISYTAMLNNAAEIGGTAGNPNTANLTYSNNPNVSSNGTNLPGTPDEPDTEHGAPTGTTPNSTVKTFTTSIVIDKFWYNPEHNNANEKLDGVTFRLTGSGLKAIKNESGLYVENADANPAYYMLTSGLFTAVAPGTDTTNYPNSVYANTNKYAYTETSSIQGTPVKVDTFGTTANGGVLTFSGLGEGTYTITEVAALNGFNLLKSPITVEIKATPDESGEGACTYAYTSDKPISGNVLSIENSKGAILPETGGIGTKLFILIGTVLAIVSGIYLVTKKRMAGIEH
jgi:fimbrial isopeptide formation D2 family protein/LPXTG-motif cell wall-anchored protein